MKNKISYLGLGAVNMATEEMCMAPIMCRTRTGECCSVEFIDGGILCPVSCNIANRQTDVAEVQSQEGISLQDIFQVTFFTATIYNTFTSFLTTTMSVSTSTTAMTPTTTTTSPTITSGMLLRNYKG